MTRNNHQFYFLHNYSNALFVRLKKGINFELIGKLGGGGGSREGLQITSKIVKCNKGDFGATAKA